MAPVFSCLGDPELAQAWLHGPPSKQQKRMVPVDVHCALWKHTPEHEALSSWSFSDTENKRAVTTRRTHKHHMVQSAMQLNLRFASMSRKSERCSVLWFAETDSPKTVMIHEVQSTPSAQQDHGHSFQCVALGRSRTVPLKDTFQLSHPPFTWHRHVHPATHVASSLSISLALSSKGFLGHNPEQLLTSLVVWQLPRLQVAPQTSKQNKTVPSLWPGSAPVWRSDTEEASSSTELPTLRNDGTAQVNP